MAPPTLSFGNFELAIFSDGTYVLDGGAMFGVVPKVLWEKKLPPDGLNRVTLGLNSLLVRTGDHNVLIETGIGNKLPEKQQQIYSNRPQLLDNLSASKISPDDIDVVINTHLHFDHCGWNTMRRGDSIVPTFPNATYYVQRGEWEHAREQHERDRVSYLTDNYDPLVENGHMRLLDGDAQVVPGISVRVFPGHTRNHQAVVITTNGQRACYTGDLLPTTAHLQPTWVLAYDLFPLDSIASRHRYYAESLPENWLTVFTHDASIPWAFVRRDAKGKYSFESAAKGVIRP
jgi:glyoxylase-like metal-dependent hydrolase (beta-lactamase superfamily II)